MSPTVVVVVAVVIFALIWMILSLLNTPTDDKKYLLTEDYKNITTEKDEYIRTEL